jgi:hypothetical protein
MNLRINPKLPFRRFYLGWLFRSEPASGRISVTARFVSNAGKGDLASFNFRWGYPLNVLLEVLNASSGTGQALEVPPFSVESIPQGSEFPWISTMESSRDQMLCAYPDLFQLRTCLVRMSPIPVVCDADNLRVSVTSQWTGGGISPGPVVFAGVRSSEFFHG